MTLDAKHRSSIYQKLLPILGEDDANKLMTEFPSIEAHELVTKEFLRAELAITRADLRGEMASLREELRGEMASLREELRGEMASLESRLLVRLGGAIAASTTLTLAAVSLAA